MIGNSRQVALVGVITGTQLARLHKLLLHQESLVFPNVLLQTEL